MAERLHPVQAGFTLIEVVVAMVVAALVLGAALELIATGARAGATLNTHRRALLLAESQLEAVAAQPDLGVGVTDGETEDGFRWQVAVETLAQPEIEDARDTPLQLYSVSVEILWGNEPGSRRLRLTSVRFARTR